jgi:hypothetical protein
MLLEHLVAGKGLDDSNINYLHKIVIEFETVAHHTLVIGTHVGDEVLELSFHSLQGPDHLIKDVVLRNIISWILIINDFICQVHIRLHNLEVLLQLRGFGIIPSG